MAGNVRKDGLCAAEERMQESKQIRRREEEEDTEIHEYYQRLEYMNENCTSCDQKIRGLIEEQQGLLNALCMKKSEFLDDIGNLFMHSSSAL